MIEPTLESIITSPSAGFRERKPCRPIAVSGIGSARTAASCSGPNRVIVAFIAPTGVSLVRPCKKMASADVAILEESS